MRGHDVDAQLDAGVDHVLRFGPQRGGRTLPGVAAVQQQGAGALRANLVDQGLQVGEAADLAVDLGCFGKVQIGKRVGFGSPGLDAILGKQMLAHQMRHFTVGPANTYIYVGFTEPDGQ